MQPVVDVKDKKRIGEFTASAPDDVRQLGNIDFVDLNSTDPEYWDRSRLQEGGAVHRAVAAFTLARTFGACSVTECLPGGRPSEVSFCCALE